MNRHLASTHAPAPAARKAPVPETRSAPLEELQAAAGNQSLGRLIGGAATAASTETPAVVASPAVRLAMSRTIRRKLAPVLIQRYTRDDIQKRAKKVYDQRVAINPPPHAQSEADRKKAADADWALAEDELKQIEVRAHAISEDRKKNPSKYPADAGEQWDWLQAEREIDLKRLGSRVITPQPKAGKSAHPTLTKGATNDASAVKEAQQKLATSPGGPAKLGITGTFDDATESAVKAFRKKNGLAETGVVDKATWDLLDVQGRSSVGRIERPWEQTLGGVVYGMTSKYSYNIDDKKILISVGINFVADATHPPADLNAVTNKWKTRILGRWNQFKAIKDGGSESRDIVFEIVASGGNTVRVVDNMEGSNAGKWSVPDNEHDNGPSHEFGHMIGLADEYNQSLAETQRLHPDWSAAQVQATKGKGGYAADSYTDEKSMMGLGALSPHDDAGADPEPRHVREFAYFVAQYLGGRWEAAKK